VRASRRLRSAAAHLPLAAVWLVAVWPVVLWLVHCSDPEHAVEVAQRAARTAVAAGWLLAGTTVVACLLFPPAPAWLRRTWVRTWTNLSTDQAPLQRARAELQHFETATRHAELGRLLRLRRQHDEAIVHLQRAVQLDDGIATAWHQLGLALFAQAEWEQAAEAFRRAERLDPGHAFGDALLHLGRAQHEQRDPQALATLQEHQRRHGGGARSHLWLADALLRVGDRAGARAALRAAAAPPRQRLSAEDNWFRALARVRLWRTRGPA
jgi:tetratricopeptide (TPR) repeat protein